jgi:L-alanine-DL-glutamate epimerase-like enolase superfamily enzyme
LEQDEVWLEYVDWWDALMGGPPLFVSGQAVVTDSPGTGFDPDPLAVQRFALDGWEQLPITDEMED